jgi:hypothetical protein
VPQGLNAAFMTKANEYVDIGQKLQHAGNVFAQVVQQEQAEKNEADIKSADSQLTEAYNEALYNQDSGYLYRKGQNATDTKDDVLSQLDQARKQIADGITNPRAQRMFNQQADLKFAAYSNQVEAHAGRRASDLPDGLLELARRRAIRRRCWATTPCRAPTTGLLDRTGNRRGRGTRPWREPSGPART